MPNDDYDRWTCLCNPFNCMQRRDRISPDAISTPNRTIARTPGVAIYGSLSVRDESDDCLERLHNAYARMLELEEQMDDVLVWQDFTRACLQGDNGVFDQLHSGLQKTRPYTDLEEEIQKTTNYLNPHIKDMLRRILTGDADGNRTESKPRNLINIMANCDVEPCHCLSSGSSVGEGGREVRSLLIEALKFELAISKDLLANKRREHAEITSQAVKQLEILRDRFLSLTIDRSRGNPVEYRISLEDFREILNSGRKEVDEVFRMIGGGRGEIYWEAFEMNWKRVVARVMANTSPLGRVGE